MRTSPNNALSEEDTAFDAALKAAASLVDDVTVFK